MSSKLETFIEPFRVKGTIKPNIVNLKIGKYLIPDNKYDQFIEAVVSDSNQTKYSLAQNIPYGGIFRMFFDLENNFPSDQVEYFVSRFKECFPKKKLNLIVDPSTVPGKYHIHVFEDGNGWFVTKKEAIEICHHLITCTPQFKRHI